MTSSEAFDALARSLIGEAISHVWRGYGSAIFVEIGRLTPRTRKDGSLGHPEGEISLGVEWSWRIEDNQSIISGSWSDESSWEPALDRLRNGLVAKCELYGFLPEIAITTDAGIRLLSFSTTDGQPQWHLVDRRVSVGRWFTVRDGQLHVGDGTEPAY